MVAFRRFSVLIRPLPITTLFPYTTLFRSGVHTFFDGVAIAAGFMIGPALGALLSIAVVLHKVPEGFTIAPSAAAGECPPGSEEHTSELQSHSALVSRVLA